MNNFEKGPRVENIEGRDGGPDLLAIQGTKRYLDREQISRDAAINNKAEKQNMDKRKAAKKVLRDFLIATGVIVAFGGILHLVSDDPDKIDQIYTDRGVEAIDGQRHMDQYYDALDRLNATDATASDDEGEAEPTERKKEFEKIYTDRGVEAIDGERHMDQYYDAVERLNSSSEAPTESTANEEG